MPEWKEFTEEQKLKVDVNLERLNQISLDGGTVMGEHVLKLDWLNEVLKKWILKQQAYAVKTHDRARDTFCRRSAVVGFRAGMLAWFLYGEKRVPPIVKSVTNFAIWVANYMLHQQVSRFNMGEEKKNTLYFWNFMMLFPTISHRGGWRNKYRLWG